MMGKLELTRIFGVLAIFAAVVEITTPANAFTFTTFEDRESWESAVEGSFSEETFNNYFAEDTSFNGTNLKMNDFTLNGIGASSRQKIDVRNSDLDLDFDVPLFSVDGTDMVLGQTDSSSSFMIKFDLPITAFGAYFSDISSQGITQITANSNLVGSIPQNSQFFGFIADEDFSSIMLDSFNDDFDGFGMDNFVYVTSDSVAVNSSPTRNFSINPESAMIPFVPVEFSPARSMPLTFDNIQNTPFNFSPALGLLSVGGTWLISYLRKKFDKQ